jgi:hypothetical protein
MLFLLNLLDFLVRYPVKASLLFAAIVGVVSGNVADGVAWFFHVLL